MSAVILIAVTHLLGSGHLVRAGHLARALAQAGHRVTLASGGMPLRAMEAEPFAFVQLPPVKTIGTDFRMLLDEAGEAVAPERLTQRREGLEALARELKPDIVVTEHFPFGRRQLADEFLALIAAAKQANSAALILSSIRDVLVVPKPERIAQAHARLAEHFDAVLVHGDPRLLPLEASWPVVPELGGKLHYTGYLAPPSLRAPGARNDGEVLVSGGGSGAALPLFRACLDAARLLGPGRSWRILVGRATPGDDFTALEHDAPGHVTVEWARPDFPALLTACALSISQAGYNTVLDLVAARCPAILVPFDAGGETEQAIRAEALRRAGLARALTLHGQGDGVALAAEVEAALVDETASLAIDTDGARGSVAAIAALLAARRSAMPA